MFDIGFSELLLIAVVALVVLGPERLPKAARFAGLWVRRARAQWYSVKSELERELAAEELKRSLHDAKRAAEELKQSVGESAADIEAKVRAAETEARREIEGMRRGAAAGIVPEAPDAADDPAAPRQPDLLDAPGPATTGARPATDADPEDDDGRQR